MAIILSCTLENILFIVASSGNTSKLTRFGPFLKWNGLFINVNKSYDFENLQKNHIEELIRERIKKDKDKLIHDWKELGIRVEKARWGRSVIIKGKKRIQLSKDIDPQKLTKEDAEGYLGKKSKK